MKYRKLLLLLLMLISVVSCRKTIVEEHLCDVSPEFAKVYALKESHPDSAIMIMDAVADTLDESVLRSRSGLQYAEYQILLAELYYKNYRQITNDNQVFQAFYFFDSIMPGLQIQHRNKNLVFLKARSYYMKAIVEEFVTKQHVLAF